jgi:hypothetical protein
LSHQRIGGVEGEIRSIHIRVSMESKSRARMKLKTKMKSTFQVSKNSLDRIPMFINTRMHKLRSLIDDIRDVGTSNGSIY